MTRPFGLFTTVWVCALALACGSAFADKTYVPSDVRITAGVWTLTPVIERDEGVSPRVHSFLAFIDKSTATGSNLTSVWFIRGQTDETPWTSKAWESTQQWEAIASVKGLLGIPPDFDAVWRTTDPKPEQMPTNPETPKEYAKGVLRVDPLSPYVDASPRAGTNSSRLWSASDTKRRTSRSRNWRRRISARATTF